MYIKAIGIRIRIIIIEVVVNKWDCNNNNTEQFYK